MSQVFSVVGYTPAARFDDVAWTTVRVEEGTTSLGPWTLIDTLTLDPVDDDPASPRTRNLTTEEASDEPNLWYRFTFVDDDNGTGQPSTPVQNATSTSFATAEDFAARIGIELTDEEVTRAEALLAAASALIQDETGQTIDLVADDELVRPGAFDDRLRLPERPVRAVSSITAARGDGDPVEVSSDSWYLDGDELVRTSFPLASEQGFSTAGRGWLGPQYTLTITYTHGYSPVPDTAKAICMEMVVRVWFNPGSVAQSSVGNTSTLYQYASNTPDTQGLLLTRSERKTLLRVFGRAAGSIALR